MKSSVAETTEQTTICEHSTQKLNHSKQESFLFTYQNPLESSLSIQSQLKSTQIPLQIGGCSKSAAFTVCKKFFKSRTVKHLLWVGRPEKCTKIFNVMRLCQFRASDVGPCHLVISGRGTCSVFQEFRGFNCTHQVLLNIIEFSKSKGFFAYFPKLFLDSIISNKSVIERMNSLTALLLLDPAT